MTKDVEVQKNEVESCETLEGRRPAKEQRMIDYLFKVGLPDETGGGGEFIRQLVRKGKRTRRSCTNP